MNTKSLCQLAAVIAAIATPPCFAREEPLKGECLLVTDDPHGLRIDCLDAPIDRWIAVFNAYGREQIRLEPAPALPVLSGYFDPRHFEGFLALLRVGGCLEMIEIVRRDPKAHEVVIRLVRPQGGDSSQ